MLRCLTTSVYVLWTNLGRVWIFRALQRMRVGILTHSRNRDGANASNILRNSSVKRVLPKPPFPPPRRSVVWIVLLVGLAGIF